MIGWSEEDDVDEKIKPINPCSNRPVQSEVFSDLRVLVKIVDSNREIVTH